jgi:mitogen-activated protein kinase kinase kinase 9
VLQSLSLLVYRVQVLASQSYTEKADVFSFAIICWEMVARQCPYEDLGLTSIQSALQVLQQGLRPKFPPPRSACAGFAGGKVCEYPKAFEVLAAECWAADPHARPTMQAAMERLEAMPASQVVPFSAC